MVRSWRTSAPVLGAVALALLAAPALAQTSVDYDDDNDNLIDIRTLAQLNAVRYDLNGDGVVSATDSTNYTAAFPNAATGMGCVATCTGYELRQNLDFDTDGDGDVDADDPNSYANWTPIAGTFAATLHGNNRAISNLTKSGPGHGGLFVTLGASAVVSNLGLVDVAVSSTGAHDVEVGALAGRSSGAVVATYVRGGAVSVSHNAQAASNTNVANGVAVGGLVGYMPSGSIRACYATADVSGAGSFYILGGGLVGVSNSNAVVAASYATGAVSASGTGVATLGGLIGSFSDSAVTNSYATGAPSSVATGPSTQILGGLVGYQQNATASASYWDSQTTGQSASALGTTKTTSELQTPTAYGSGAMDIYAAWDDYDTNADGTVDADDDAWNFGTAHNYPALKFAGMDVAAQGIGPEEGQRTPTNVRAQSTAQGLLVTWQAAAGATAYRVQWRLPGQAWSSARQAETTRTRYLITGLADGDYEVRIVPLFDGEPGTPSATTEVDAGPPGNRAPSAGRIADMDLDVGETAAVDLDSVFDDPDGDTLRYAVSATGSAVEAWVSGSTLRLRGRRPGEATATVTATDPDGLSASASFELRIGAVLSLHGSASVPEGGAAVLEARLSRALDSDIEVRWRLAADGDPATADADDADFAGMAGTAAIAAGETRAPVVVKVLDDDDIEPARERIAVLLEQPEERRVALSAESRALATVQEGVCDRSPEVRAELARGWRECRWPRPRDLSSWSTLDLRGHGAASLRPNDLLGLSRLRTLDLGRNALRELPAGLLRHAPRLRSLRLDRNRLATLPAGLFAGLDGLRELRLAGNPGAPFALAPELRREDAEPWAAGPATVRAHLPSGAPFGLRLALSAAGGEASAGGGPAEALAFAAGAVASGVVRVSGAGPVRVLLAAPAIPETRCGDGPCFDGLAGEESALALFAEPPRVSAEVPAADLLGSGDARIDLSAHFAASGEAGGLAYAATVDDPRLAAVSVAGSILTVSANEDFEEGTATVTVVATDDAGQTATLRFQVEVSPRPAGRWRGWRRTLTTTPVGP